MTETKFKVGMKCKNGLGHDARIICTDLEGEYPIVAAITIKSIEKIELFTNNGEYIVDGSLKSLKEHNLILPKKRITGWLNVYEKDVGFLCSSREEAEKEVAKNRIACIKIDVEEGEGLDSD